MHEVFVVACCKTKREGGPVEARHLYTSPLFKKSYEHALRASQAAGSGLPLILSAKHGLISSEAIVEPYQLSMDELNAADRFELDVRVFKQACLLAPNGRVTFHVYGGVLYLRAMQHAARGVPGWAVVAALKGEIGERLQWLNRELGL
jgi:hypothetical protein